MPLRDESNRGRLSSGWRANVNVGAMRSLRRVLCLASVVGMWMGCSVNQAGLTDGEVPADADVGTAGIGGAGIAGRGGGGGTTGTAGTAGSVLWARLVAPAAASAALAALAPGRPESGGGVSGTGGTAGNVATGGTTGVAGAGAHDRRRGTRLDRCGRDRRLDGRSRNNR